MSFFNGLIIAREQAEGFISTTTPAAPTITIVSPSIYQPVRRRRRISPRLLQFIKDYLELKTA